MKKTSIAVLLALCLALTALCPAFGEETAPAEAVTAEALAEWAGELKARALETTPENDPADESADMEDGIQFLYPFATLFADRAEMTADTRVKTVVIASAEEASFRGIEMSMTPQELISLFPNDNPDLAGTHDMALLYLRETEDGGILYGRVYRDGQRIYIVEYAHLVPAGDGYRLAMLTCSFTESLLVSFRAEGFGDTGDPLLGAEDRDALSRELHSLAAAEEYRAVKSSRDGASLTPFGVEDLVFSGLDFLALQPEDMPGTPETATLDNEDGSSLIRVDGDGYVAVFMSDSEGTRIVSLSLEDESLEGPRGVRLGDAFHEDLQRFRFEDRGSDGTTEVLYGGEGEVPRGIMESGGLDGLALRYVTALPDGREAELLLRYTLSHLSEIILHIQ